MKNLISKLNNNFFKKIVPIATLVTFWLGPLVYSKEKPFSFEAIPVGSGYDFEKSDFEYSYFERYGFSHGAKFNKKNRVLKIEDSSLEWDTSNGEVSVEDKNGERVCVTEFFDSGVDVFSYEELRDILIPIINGEKPWQDVVLSKEENKTLGDFVYMFSKLEDIAQVTQGENFLGYKFNISGVAELKAQMLVNQKNADIEFTYGTEVHGLANADAHLFVNLNRNGDFSFEDLISGKISFEGDFNADMGWKYNVFKTINKFWQLRKNNFTLGVLNKNSEIETAYYDYKADFNFGIDADINNLSAANIATYSMTNVKEAKSIKQIDSTLFYKILGLENVLLMTGTERREILETIESSETFEEISVDKDSENFKRMESSDTVSNRSSEKDFFYGLTFIGDFVGGSKYKTSASFFVTSKNYPEKTFLVGSFFNNPYFNFKMNHISSDKEINDGEAFLTILGNSKNKFYDYFREEVRNEINPLKENLSLHLRKDLLRETNGIFLTYSENNLSRKVGGIVALEGAGYYEFGKIEGEYENGSYFRMNLGSFEVGAKKESYNNSMYKGERMSSDVSWFIDNWNINFQIYSKADELGVEGFELHASRAF